MSKTNASRRRARGYGKPLPKIPDMTSGFEQQGMVNGYTCPLGHEVYTLVSDPGTTPMKLACRHTEERGNPPVTVECGLSATSMFFRVPANTRVTHEWYRPDDTERRKLSPGMSEHVDMGGLMLRELAEPREVTGTNAVEAGVS